MKNEEVARHYNQLYRENEIAYSGEPLPLIKTLSEYLINGTVLEVGAGGGRNSLFLASLGLAVTANDISLEAIEKLKSRAAEGGFSIKTEVVDAAVLEIKGEYDAIVCTLLLHYLSDVDARALIRKMQEHAKPSGFNLIIAFTQDGKYFRELADKENFYLKNKEELENMYTGWSIHKIFEKDGWVRILGKGETYEQNVFVGLLAQKK